MKTLAFADFYGGSGRAWTPYGAFLVVPTPGGWIARHDRAGETEWTSGPHEDASDAQAACQTQFDLLEAKCPS